ncbi:hypothetical protein MTR67_009112 [Solanum verrucosum]|uniref:Protein kinase domain-containing protein n=1 Tax=Solanum verrucosum TaxID=315347 RepID=A0AAF0TD33_SOLVR|nr:hypothetical protein MTR67_009112 [Solanum verrucosum]
MAISWFKKKRIIHPVQEEFFSEDACNRFRRMILRRTIHNRRRTTSRRIKIEPKLSRFWLESQGRLIPPPVPPAPVPVERRSLIDSLKKAFVLDWKFGALYGYLVDNMDQEIGKYTMYFSAPIDCSSQVLVGEPVRFSLCSFIGLDPLFPLTHSEDRKLATFQLIRSEPVPFFGISEILKSFQGAITDSVRLRKPKYEGLFQILQSLIQLFKVTWCDLVLLEELHLSENNLQVFKDLFLRHLGNALDLLYSNMSGVIPKSLEALKKLVFFNVSFNRLHGEIPIGRPYINLSYQSFMSNEGLCGNPQKHVPVVDGFVYKGTLADGMTVAVKVFNVQMEGTFQTFDRECEIFRNLRHRNLTKIISSCCNLDFKALILEYMPNKSLNKLLYSRDYCLTIMQKSNIVFDIASALEFLHHGYSVPVIRCDLKPSNVLLRMNKTDVVAALAKIKQKLSSSELLGFDHYIPPFASAEGSQILEGVNYASGSAGICNDSGNCWGDDFKNLCMKYEKEDQGMRLSSHKLSDLRS